MTALVIDGKKIAQQLRNDLAQEVKSYSKRPYLAVVWVGDNEASGVYVRNKQKAALETGINCKIYHLAEHTSEQEIISLVQKLNRNSAVDGIIVQLPLPKHVNTRKILETIYSSKDVDAFKAVKVGELWKNIARWSSATPEGVICLLKTVCPSLAGKHAVVIGRSDIVGKPMAAMLLNEDCTVTMTHSKTVDLPTITKMADILVVACGSPKLVKKNWVKKGAVVIDVGISKGDGKLVGDVDFDEVKEVASALTPVPGGVGPMTIAMLLKNTVEAMKKRRKL